MSDLHYLDETDYDDELQQYEPDYNGGCLLRLLTALLCAVLVLASFGVGQAGKPQPPYPPPGGEFQQQAYPPPVPTYQAPMAQYPSGANPQPGVPYAWGYFAGRWWISIDGVGFEPDLSGQICVTKSENGLSVCYPVIFYAWEASLGRNWYTTTGDCRVGTWFVYYAALGAQTATIRQPNNYIIRCVWLPSIRRG